MNVLKPQSGCSAPWPTRAPVGVAPKASTTKTVVTGHSRRGLTKLSPEKIGKAINERDKQVNSIMLAFVGAVAFCVLSLFTPDIALLGGTEKARPGLFKRL